MEPRNISASRETIEGLDTVFVGPLDPENPVKAVVILLHGFGATGMDLVPCAPELISLGGIELENVVFLFPEAPLDLADQGMPGGRAWWPINMARLMEMFEVKNFDQLASVSPEELPQESDRIERLIDDVMDRFSLPRSRLILGGFSQGAMLSCDVGLRFKGELGGLILWSGTLLARSRWADLAADSKPMEIVQSHGRFDDVLPFPAAEKLRDFLSQLGNHVNFIPFDGFHQTHPDAMKAAVELIQSITVES